MPKEYAYGLLTYNSMNIGDEIQSVAASRFLPFIEEQVYREQIHKFKPKNNKLTKVIMNAWWMWKPKNFPPSKWIKPLLTSMHIRPEVRKTLFTKKTKEYLIKHGPVGCRDMGTLEWLETKGVPAYFSGCLTVTLQRNYNIPRSNYILCVDTSDEVVNEIKRLTKRPVYSITRLLSPMNSSADRYKLAKLMLRLYHDAHLVVSSRLHVIMPSLAMETPVLRIISNEEEMGETSRYKGFENFFNSINLNDGLEELSKYDFENPLSNPTNHHEVRESLIKRCADFTGYDNPKSLIDENINPFFELLKLNVTEKKTLQRMAYFIKSFTLLKIFFNRVFGVNKYTINDDMFS